MDPFVGSGNSGVAALAHGCNVLGFDVFLHYVTAAKEKIGRRAVTLGARAHLPPVGGPAAPT